MHQPILPYHLAPIGGIICTATIWFCIFRDKHLQALARDLPTNEERGAMLNRIDKWHYLMLAAFIGTWFFVILT